MCWNVCEKLWAFNRTIINSDISVDGHKVSASNGAFTGAVALTPGANAISAAATNSAGTSTATVNVTYTPPQTGVQGHVSSAEGPVANAGISLAPGALHAVTGADGSYAIEAAAGTYSLSVDAQGYQPLSQSVTVTPVRLVTVG